MNRTIKFRAWDKKKKKMRKNVSTGTITVWGGEDGDFDSDSEAVDCDFMQFTGLLDKNGKDLYENDIVRFPDKVTTAPQEVLWQNAHLRTRNAKGWWGDPKSFSAVEIIGNIYENPDLLNTK